ncbi:transporter substrate-binding domain-containing protein [Streptomyces sp. NPDC020330]|uniref:transporter substrate-binding domain-containing protein n=1 Tax=unclassified Streptomyces TaxID=2593676 RepID=UPI0037882FA8
MLHNDLPGVSYNKNYRRSGIDVLLYEHLKKEMKAQFSGPADVSSSERIPKLLSEDADLVIASFSITGDRMRKVDFVGPYLTTRQGFLVGPKNAHIKTDADMRGKRVCTWEGTTSTDVVEEIKDTTGLAPVELDDASDCIEALIGGRTDAVSTDKAILYGFAELHVEDRLSVVRGVEVGGPQHYGVAMRKDSREDCRKIAAWMKKYVGTSTWTQDMKTSLPLLVTKEPDWISDYKPNPAAIDARSCRDKLG